MKILYFLLTILATSVAHSEENLKIFFGGISHHANSDLQDISNNTFRYNERHALIGVEYEKSCTYSATIFNDSFNMPSIALSIGKEYDINNYFSYGIQAFVASKGQVSIDLYETGVLKNNFYRKNLVGVLPYIQYDNFLVIRFQALPTQVSIDNKQKTFPVFMVSFGYQFNIK